MKGKPLTEFPLPPKRVVNWVEMLSPISRFIAEETLKESKKKIEEINNKPKIK